MTRDRSPRVWLVLFSWCVLGCGAQDGTRDHSAFEVGMDRSAVLVNFGPPDQQQTLFKQSNAIWGPIEDFWSEVPSGAKVEIWSYASRTRLVEGSAETTPGSTELYFVNDSMTVQGVGFAPEGVVY